MDNRCRRTQSGRMSVPAITIAGIFGALWIFGVAIAGGVGLSAWALPVAVAVVGSAAGVCWVFTKLSHGGDWGWTRLHRSRPRRVGAVSWR